MFSHDCSQPTNMHIVMTLSGEIDRVTLGRLIFDNASLRRKLNKATHLPVAWELVKQILTHWLCCRWV